MLNKIIITGGGTGLGRELARGYSLKGYHIIIIGRTINTLKNVQGEINNSGGKCNIYKCDISNVNEVKKIIDNIIDTHKDIDILINNAGVGYFGPIEETNIEEINNMIDINLKGTIFVTREIVPYFKNKGGGKIINIISTAGLKGKVNEGVYCASKFGVRGFTEGIKKELIDFNIKVIPVYMGGMNTSFWDDSSHIKDKSRLKSPKDIAKVIIDNYICKEEIIIES